MAPHLLPEDGTMYTTTVINEVIAVRQILKEELKCYVWEILKHPNADISATTNDVTTNRRPKIRLSRSLSDIASYIKRVH